MAGRGDPAGPTEARFAAILADAARQYSETSGENLDEFMKPPVKNVDDLKKQLESQNTRFSHFREKRHALFSAMSTMLAPVEIIGEMVAGGASEVFAPAEGVYAAVAYLINAAHDVSAIYDSIVELFEQLQDFTSRLEVYVKHEMSPALREKLVNILASLFQVLVLAGKAAHQGRVKAYFKRLVGSEIPVQAALEKLKQLTLGEERQVIAETYGGVSQLNIQTEQVQDVVNQVHQEVVILRNEARDRTTYAHRDKLKEILEPSPYPEDFYTSFNRSRVEGTGEWILDDPGLQDWLDEQMPYLWICGAAGTGKSFLTSKILAWSAEKLSHFAYFFFRDNNPETRSVLQALRDVAYQLSEVDAFYSKQLLKRLSTSDDIKTIPSAFRRLFVQPFENDMVEKTIYIFLDGIDEAVPDQINQLLQLLSNDEDPPEKPPRVKIQLALTGRSHMTDTVISALDPLGQGQDCATLLVTTDRNAADVNSYIVEGVYRSRILNRTSSEFKDKIIKAMQKQVDGLFILAKFMFAEINRKRHAGQILESVQSYPSKINEMLMRSITSLAATISGSDAEDLNEMLRWVACAEEVLSLEQLEAVLALKFGDPPLGLEETLRGQYSCFFELEREDGLTTDDLVREYERKQHSRNDSPGGRHSSPGHRSSPSRSSPGRSASPRIPISPALSDDEVVSSKRRLSSSLPNGARKQLSPSPARRYFSPISSPDPFDPVTGMEFRSNKANTWVTFFHTSIKEFFSKEDSRKAMAGVDGATIGFEPTSTRVHIVKTCLSIFTDPAWFNKNDLGDGREAIKQYAAWYWQEHLAAIDPAKISPEQKRELGPRLYKMLTDDNVIFDWSIVYEKNGEGLDVLTDNNIKALKRWMADPEVLSSLDPEAKDWTTKAITQIPGIFKPIGQFYAKAWLSSEFKKYVPTLFCFKIVQAIAFMEDGLSWTQTNTHWSEIPIEKRIQKAAEWAHIEETAHWHRRIGSTYLTQGMHNAALAHYDQALKLDKNSVETNGRIAFCLSRDGRFKEALAKALECEAIEEKSIASGTLDEVALKGCKWRLYKDHILIARCYSETGQVDDSLKYFLKAAKSATTAGLGLMEYFEPEIGYLEVLANENRHSEIVAFLKELQNQSAEGKFSRNRLVDFLLDQSDKPLVMDYIPRAGAKAGQIGLLTESYDLAVQAATALRDPVKALYLRISLGTALTYNRDVDDAIGLFEEICFDEYRPRGSVPTRQGYAISFQKLAALYKGKVLHAGLGTPEAIEWMKQLKQVQAKQSKHQNLDMPLNMVGSDVNVASIYLALFYRLLGRNDEAMNLLKVLVKDSLVILSDDDQANDEYALENLLSLLLAANDLENASALSHSMRRINALVASTPTESPVQSRMEPKLPEIQTAIRSCAQCLDHLTDPLDYAFCQYCLDSYCIKCLDEIIKKDGNKTSDRRIDVICRSDHVWLMVPPLNRVLHRGEILMSNGKVSSFVEWKTALQSTWK